MSEFTGNANFLIFTTLSIHLAHQLVYRAFRFEKYKSNLDDSAMLVTSCTTIVESAMLLSKHMISPQKQVLAGTFLRTFQTWLLLCQQEDNLTERVQRELHLCSLFLIGRIQAVTGVTCHSCTCSPLIQKTSYFISDVEQQGVCLSAVRVKLELPSFDPVWLLNERHAVARSIVVTVQL